MDCTISSVPREIKQLIVSFLEEDRTRRLLRAASTEWMNIINYDHFTIYFAHQSTLEDVVRTFARYQKLIGLSFKKTKQPVDTHYTILAQLTNLTSLEVESGNTSTSNRPKILSADLLHFTTLTALQKINFWGLDCTKLMLDHFVNLTQLHLRGGGKPIPGGLGEDAQKVNLLAKLSNLQRIRSLRIEDHYGALTCDEASVAKMSNLTNLELIGQTTYFPFSKLPNLETLYLYTQHHDDFSACTKLTSLRLENTANTVCNISQLEALTHLKQLHLLAHKDEQHVFLPKLSNLESLTHLMQLGQDRVIDLVQSSKLTKLRVNLNSIDGLVRFPHLRDLELTGTQSVTSPAPFTSVTCLIAFKLSNSSVLRLFPNLRALDLRCSLKFDECQYLPSLTDLESLHANKIDNATLQLLGTLAKLNTLAVTFDDADTYDCRVFHSLTALTQLTLLPKQMNSIRQRGLWQSISYLTNLERLDVFCIDDEGIKVLESLSRLKTLNLRLRDNSFDEGRLTNLRNLQTVTLPSGATTVYPHLLHCKLKHLPYFYECSCLL